MFNRPHSWTCGAALPCELSSHSALSIRNTLYIFGGTSGSHWVYAWNDHFEWERRERIPLSSAMGKFSCVADGEVVYVVGGDPSSMMSYHTHTGVWQMLTPPPISHLVGAAVLWQGQVMLLGGQSKNWYGCEHDQISIFNLTTKTWDISDVKLHEPLLFHSVVKIQI